MKAKQPLSVAAAVAADLVVELRPFCERIEVAGSVRRRKAQVGDLEIVALPVAVTDLFGEPTGRTLLDDWLAGNHIQPSKNGTKYKQFIWQGSQVDLFLAQPDNYGVILMLRTGDADFSRRMVTLTTWGGFKPAELTVSDGGVWRQGKQLAVPDEETLFRLWGMAWVPPEERIGQTARVAA